MGQKFIMLADDDKDDSEMFCEAVEIAATDVICLTAINGEELLKKLHGSDRLPNIIFLDMNMPIMNGWECLAVLKTDQRYKEIPVIMISTSSHREDVATCLESGALCYLVKPVDFNILVRLVKKTIEHIGTGSPYLELLQDLKNDGHIMCN
jgi:CheY-like chemotaxis protein